MKQRDVTGLVPANDNPRNDRQPTLFDGVREIVVGPTSIGERVRILGQQVDGMLIVHEVLDQGDGPVAARA